jgi:GTP-binding protein HflX
VGDRLFHTLDPTTRGYEFEGRRYLVTDTVGFIEKLPHQLVEAFRATLEETVLSDLLLQVVDASSDEERMLVQMQAADSVLSEIGAGDKPRILVLNKIDLLDADQRAEVRIRLPDAIPVSASTGEGLEVLKAEIDRVFEDTMAPVELFVPYSQGARLHDLHEVAGHIEREDEPDGVRVRTRLPSGQIHRFKDLAVG